MKRKEEEMGERGGRGGTLVYLGRERGGGREKEGEGERKRGREAEGGRGREREGEREEREGGRERKKEREGGRGRECQYRPPHSGDCHMTFMCLRQCSYLWRKLGGRERERERWSKHP